MNLQDLINIARPYGVTNITLGGCLQGKQLGFQGAMRRSAHAHNYKGDCHCTWHKKYVQVQLKQDYLKHEQNTQRVKKWFGQICVKSSHVEKLLTKDGRPNQLFWHEVAHIYRPSWTQGECDKFGWQMVRKNS